MRVLVVTGSGTGVGKTVTAAALAALASGAGRSVAVVKPVQTGVGPGEPGGDLDEIRRLTGVTELHEFARYAEPLAPGTAARRIGSAGPTLAELADGVCALADRDVVVVEGAGGALVHLNTAGLTLLDLVAELSERGLPVELVLTATSGLGTLHVAAATTRAATQHGLAVPHLVISDWPASEPGLAQRCNLTDLPAYTGVPLHGVIVQGAGRLDRAAFAAAAMRSLTPALGGTFDAQEFVRLNAATPNRGDTVDAGS